MKKINGNETFLFIQNTGATTQSNWKSDLIILNLNSLFLEGFRLQFD